MPREVSLYRTNKAHSTSVGVPRSARSRPAAGREQSAAGGEIKTAVALSESDGCQLEAGLLWCVRRAGSRFKVLMCRRCRFLWRRQEPSASITTCQRPVGCRFSGWCEQRIAVVLYCTVDSLQKCEILLCVALQCRPSLYLSYCWRRSFTVTPVGGTQSSIIVEDTNKLASKNLRVHCLKWSISSCSS